MMVWTVTWKENNVDYISIVRAIDARTARSIAGVTQCSVRRANDKEIAQLEADEELDRRSWVDDPEDAAEYEYDEEYAAERAALDAAERSIF